VRENLIIENDPNKLVVGTTRDVTGSFQIKTGDSPTITGMNITVDLRNLKTDSNMRDNYVQRNSLQTDTYPEATFVSTCAEDLPASYSDGQDVTFSLAGNLTMHGKTNQAVFQVTGKVSGQTVTGTATSKVFMTDYGIEPPNVAVAVAQNEVEIKLEFTAQKK
jgi:polyisoprenoid-binding protein YceI